MAKSRKGSPKRKSKRKTFSFTSTRSEISSAFSDSASFSSTNTAKLSLHLSPNTIEDCKLNLSIKSVPKNSFDEMVDATPNEKKINNSKSSDRSNSAEFSVDNYRSPSVRSKLLDSSVWSTRPSDVLTTIDNKKSPSKNRLSIKNRRKTLAIGDISENFVDLTPNDANICLELPPTQPSGPLKDVVAFVEVYSGAENRTRYIANEIRSLGATVSQRFTNKVTHVIFREGLQSTIEKARARNVPCVSALWIDSCRRRNEKVPEIEFKINDVSESGVPIIVGRLRKPRSMQPERFDPDVVLSDERIRRRVKRAEAYRLMKEIKNFNVDDSPMNDKANPKPFDAVLVEDTPTISDRRVEIDERSSNSECGWRAFTETFTPDSLRMQMSQLQRKIAGLLGSSSENNSNDSSFEEDSLAENVKKKLFGPGGLLFGTPPPSFLGKKRVVVPNSMEQNSSPPEKYNGGTMDTSPVSRKRFIVRDSVEDGDKSASNANAASDDECIVPETNTIDLMSPPRRFSPEVAIAKSSSPDVPPVTNRRELLSKEPNFGKKTNVSDHNYFNKPIFSPPKSKNNPQRTNPDVSSNSSVVSSSVSVGPVMIVRRQSSGCKLVSTAVNTSDDEGPSKPIQVTRRSSLEPEERENSTSDVLNQLTTTTKCVDSVTNVINHVCQKVLPSKNDKSSVQTTTTKKKKSVERKKHLFANDQEIFGLSSATNSKTSSPTRSSIESTTTMIEKIATHTMSKEDILNVFEPKPIVDKAVHTKRLRSSMFFVKTSSTLANELQHGRPSPEEFRSKIDSATKKMCKNRRRTIAASSSNVKTTTKIVKNPKRIGRPSLVLTSVVGSDRDAAQSVVKNLGKFSLETKVSEKTTHIICGDVRRTLTVLYGLVRGCYILSLDWVFRSAEKGQWLNEENFQIKQFKSSKKRKLSLSSPGPIFVSSECKPPSDDIKNLIKLCDGKVSSTAKRSRICVGKVKNKENVDAVVVTETWLLDSITKQKMLPYDSYLL